MTRPQEPKGAESILEEEANMVAALYFANRKVMSEGELAAMILSGLRQRVQEALEADRRTRAACVVWPSDSPSWITHDPEALVFDGSAFAIALRVTDSASKRTEWEIHTVHVLSDGENFQLYNRDENGSGDAFTSWEWEDAEFVFPLNNDARSTVNGFKTISQVRAVSVDELRQVRTALEIGAFPGGVSYEDKASCEHALALMDRILARVEGGA